MLALDRLAQRELIVRQYKLGVAPTEIAAMVGSSIQAVVQMARRAGCPPQNEKLSRLGQKSAEVRRRKKVQDQRNQVNREMSANKRAAGLNRFAQGAQVGEEVWALMAAIPFDTRNITARTFGDPLPGRSALDRRPQSGDTHG